MQFNVAQQLMGPIGSIKSYDIEAELSEREDMGLVKVKGLISSMRTDEGILVQGDITAFVYSTCVRCLSTFRREVTLRIEDEYLPISAVPPGSSASSLEAEGLLINSAHILDLEPALREYAFLSAPMKPLCRPDCAGLCASCGVNLNERSCSCARQKGMSTGARSSSPA